MSFPTLILSVFSTLLPVQAADGRLGPSDVVKQALLHSPKLRAARAGRDAALAANDRDKPVARPTVSIEAMGQLQGPRVTFPRVTPGDETVVPEKYGRLELMIEQILYRPGLPAARSRFNARSRSAELELGQSEQETAIEAVRAYYAYESANAQAAVAREGADMARRQLDLTRTLLEAGTVSERDVRASEADSAEAELGTNRAEAGVALARANLNRVLGREPSLPLDVSANATMPAAPLTLSEATSEALKRRPELQILTESLAGARAGVTLAGTQNSPTLSFRAIGAAQTDTALTDNHFLAAGLAVRWTPFDQGKTRADVREAKARVSQLEALRDDAILGIKLEVEKAWRESESAAGRVAVAERQVAAAEAALEVSRVRYEAGSATQLEVSGSLFGVIRARSNRAQAESDRKLALAELAHAAGMLVPSQPQPGRRP